MKAFLTDIVIPKKAERPFPNQEILWGSQDGGLNRFPSLAAAYERKYSGNPVPLQKFGKAISEAQERIWIVDEYILMPVNGKPESRIEQILLWLPLWLTASDIRFLTKRHKEIDSILLKKFQKRADEINNYESRRKTECRIEVRTHLTQNKCDFVHDRFAIIDDELWHFGGTTGGFHPTVSAASRGWRAADHGAIDFFNEIWNAEAQK